MANRQRDIVPTIVDRENIHVKPVKALAKPRGLSKRPALDELGNKINGKLPSKLDPTKDSKPVSKPQDAKNGTKKELSKPKSFSSIQINTVIEDVASSDPLMVPEYLYDIFNYLREYEVQHAVKEDFLEGHKSSPRMRTILVNWLVQVHTNFGLCLETLHLCVSMVDRYLQENKEVNRANLQLVGTAALLVACKYEEMYLPELSDFVYICDNTYSSRQILHMEMSILMSLDYNLGKPLSIHFLRHYSKIGKVRIEQHNLSKYLLELALLDHTLSHVKPSLQAVAAFCFSMAILNDATCLSKIWTPELIQRTGYQLCEFKHIIIKFANLLMNANSTKSKYIPNKYAQSKFNKVSIHPKLKGVLVKKLAELPS